MVKKQRSTSRAASRQPVRFYKFIALSFLVITIALLGLIVFMSSKRATIVITTKPEVVETRFSVNVSGDAMPAAGAIPGFVTSTSVSFEYEAHPEGVREEEGAAEGRVTIYNDGNVGQPLVATTRLLTPDGVLFRLKERVLVPAGSSIETEVYADAAGAGGNIGPSDFTIPGLNATLQKLIYAKSGQSMTGGIRYVGVVSAEDIDAARTRVEEELKKQAQLVLSSRFPSSAGIVSVVQHTAESDTETGTETDRFTVTGRATAVGVFYTETDMKTYASDMLKKQLVGSNEALQPHDGAPSALLNEYNLAAGTATLDVSYDGLATLDPNSKDLQKLMFFGKTADEARRYVLSLDHVHSVDISFRPLWNRTVPHVADHIEVIVRQVE